MQKLLYNLKLFFLCIPGFFVALGRGILNFFKKCGLGIKNEFVDIGTTFTRGNWAVKVSFLVFGFGNFFHGQILRGILFFLFEAIFITYMFLPSGGIYWLSKGHWFQTGATLGTTVTQQVYDPIYDAYIDVITDNGVVVGQRDDSVKVMLYGLLTILFIIAFIYTWRLQVKQCRICTDITAQGKKVKSGKDDLRSLVDDQFHKTLLSLPLAGIMMFTILPTIYMVLVAFTSYDGTNNGYSNLFSWVGLDNFNQLLDFNSGGLGLAFGELLSWTLMWSFFATFTNYFLGMFVAILINKKGIKFKKFWRTALVMTIAIPQFVSLLYVSKLFDDCGVIGKFLLDMGWFPQALLDMKINSLWDHEVSARIMLIVINIWIGIPYIMLMATGILMNIPQDLYESSKIDGASAFQQYTRITLPYMLFVTGPYLLTSFVGNLNNFNVIYLLTGGNPLDTQLGTPGGASVGSTDLLITWLFKMTVDSPESKYYAASVIGIMIFIVVAVLSLVVYNIIPSTRNEEDFK